MGGEKEGGIPPEEARGRKGYGIAVLEKFVTLTKTVLILSKI